MSYQVLARKWRPANFNEMVGQTHVLRALINALDQQRLHHAYLFTGTRGVGKTTVARLLAKSLNCEQGITSSPCGTCAACVEISQGRFVDLIEVDAASRTKVEDTRELLDNVQYLPTRGRFKVYLIDEVHMLSASSFNALLKTLEEPPEHVKFLLATTDPQKLPVTVLSRCLQFNLKNMSREHIVGHLKHILDSEQITHDEGSLWAIAEGAQGSMRDALSLTDQAIAFGQGQLVEKDVTEMLGTVDLKRVKDLVQTLFRKNADALMKQVAELDEHSPDYNALMTDVMHLLHRIAIAQAAPNAIDNSQGDQEFVLGFARQVQPEDVHLFYQIAIKAKPEMHLAPSDRAGFEMAMLRMLAFSQTPPVTADLPALETDNNEGDSAPPVPPSEAAQTPQSETLESETPQSETPQSETPQVEATRTAADQPEQQSSANKQLAEAESQAFERSVQTSAAERSEPSQDNSQPPEPLVVPEEKQVEQDQVVEAVSPMAMESSGDPIAEPVADDTPLEPAVEVATAKLPTQSDPTDAVEPVSEDSAATILMADAVQTKPAHAEQSQLAEIASTISAAPSATADEPQWPEVSRDEEPVKWWQVTVHQLRLEGMVKTIFSHSEWRGFEGQKLMLTVSPNYQKILNDTYRQKLLLAVQERLPNCQAVDVEFGAVDQTPHAWMEQIILQAKDKAYNQLQQDSFVQSLVAEYEAQLAYDTVEPRQHPLPRGV